MAKKIITPPTPQQQALLSTLQARFAANPQRHQYAQWPDVQTKLLVNVTKLASLQAMEETGGEPDVIGMDEQTGEYIFCDCSAESPAGRRSLCYDDEGLAARKEHRPNGSAVGMAEEMGIELLTEANYRHLQTLGAFDTKTSSWLKAPAAVRELGGAIFGDRRYNQVFVYHNGAQSYYAARGFRGKLQV